MKKMFLLFLMPVSPKLQQHTDGGLTKYIGNVLKNITDNVLLFPKSALLVSALELKAEEFSVACSKVKNGPAGSAAAKNALRVVLEQQFNYMAACAWAESDNSIEKFEKTGIGTRKKNERHSSVDTPTQLVLKKGSVANSLQLSFKKVKYVRYYKISVTLADGTFVKEVFSTNSRKTTITGLIRGQEYFVKIAACGAGKLKSDWSSMVNAICS